MKSREFNFIQKQGLNMLRDLFTFNSLKKAILAMESELQSLDLKILRRVLNEINYR